MKEKQQDAFRRNKDTYLKPAIQDYGPIEKIVQQLPNGKVNHTTDHHSGIGRGAA